MKRKIPEHGSCFVCGAANPKSLGLAWFTDDAGDIFAEFSFNLSHQGPPGHAHGGALAAVLDEAMGAAVWRAGLQVVAARLEVDYKHPVPLGEPVQVLGRIGQKEGRKVFAHGEISLPGGRLAASGRGIYVHAPHLFEEISFNVEPPQGED